MYDAGKIIPGLVLFLGVMTLPFWLNVAGGTPAAAPKLELPQGYTRCVEPTALMRATHMELLNRWRNLAVRHADRIFVTTTGHRYARSLTGTCLGCHEKKTFCDRCHGYMGVAPYCWNCHVAPKGGAR